MVGANIDKENDMAVNYEKANKRSPYATDVDRVQTYLKALEAMEALDGFVYSGEVVIANSHGYIIGTLWYDGDSEGWRVDFNRFGETA